MEVSTGQTHGQGRWESVTPPSNGHFQPRKCGSDEVGCLALESVWQMETQHLSG